MREERDKMSIPSYQVALCTGESSQGQRKKSLLEEFPGCPETCGELQGSTALQFQRGSSSFRKSTRQGNKYLLVKCFLHCFVKDGIAFLSKYLVMCGT